MDAIVNGLAFQQTQSETEGKAHSAARHELTALTGLRFFAALFILMSHSSTWLGSFSNSEVLRLWIGESVAVFAMPLFFVLSGFVIHYNYSDLFATTKLRWAATEFFSHRVARLWPLYLFGLIIGATAQMLVSWLDHNKTELLIVGFHDLSATQSWFYAIFFNQLLLYFGFGLGWSVSTEIFFYVCYIFVARGIRALNRPRLAVGAWIGLALLALGISYAAARYRYEIQIFGTQYIKGAILDGPYAWDRWLLYYSPYSRFFEFLLGALTAQTYLVLSAHKPSIKEHKFGQFLLTISLIGLGLISLAWSTEITGDVFRSMMLNFGCAAPIALLIFCVSRYQSGVREALSVDRLRGLGDLSYSIYVMHTWILWIFMRPGPPGPATAGTIADALLRMAVGIALTLIVSTATYRLIEVPGRLWLRARLGSELTKRMGSRDENLLAPTGMSQFRHVVAPLGGLALFLAVCLAYQFIVVARYR